jgi:hypothetical protein
MDLDFFSNQLNNFDINYSFMNLYPLQNNFPVLIDTL